MYRKKALVAAVSVALGLSGPASAVIEEVVVTATKRESSTQDIPVAVSVLDEKSMSELGVTNFEDYMLQLPGVTAGGSGPGQNTIYIRGVASSTPALTTSGVAGLAPNVALYLDEQPLSQPGRNLDVYAADLSRVEVLSGPQGTLFGASSQAGTVRLITNKPDPSYSGGKIKVGTAFTKDGDMSSNVEAVFNTPVNDSLTIRGVVYHDDQGGYVDNVRGTQNLRESGRFRTADTVRLNGLAVGSRAGKQANSDLSGVTFLDADNSAIVEENFNDVTYSGGRITGSWEMESGWKFTLAHTY